MNRNAEQVFDCLRAAGLCFAYRSRPVLEKVSFELRPGELLCLLGPNGVGKSTLFRCILGLNQGYQGRITLGERDVRTLKPQELAKQIAYIPQYSASMFDYSVFEMVLMGTTASLGTFGNPGKAQKQAAQQALERMGITHLSRRSAAKLSGGERQLVLIARALAQDARFLLMDEPTANLDYGNQLRVMQMIADLAGQGYGILLSTHNPEHALRYGNRVMVLKDGRVLSCGEPEQALDSGILSAAYGVAVQIKEVSFNGRRYRICLLDQKGFLK